MTNSMPAGLTVPQQRQWFSEHRADSLVPGTDGRTRRWVPAGHATLSKVASFFEDAGRLIVVAGPHPTKYQDRDADYAVAYGLAHAGDRRLVAVLPADASHATRTRAPWIKNMEVWTYDLDDVTQNDDYSSLSACADRSADEVIADYAGVGDVQHIGDDQLDRYLDVRAPWVDRLTRWAEEDPDLQAAHVHSYLAWHCRGRMVLKIAKARGALRVTAGVHHADAANRPQPFLVDGLIKPGAAHRLIAAASLAAADKLEEIDTGHLEHQLQAALAGALDDSLGVSHPRREYPAFRPTKDKDSPARAYIDFLGHDDDGRMHVVETKIGNDPMLVLQGLDYWIWATANAATLQANFGLPSLPKVVLDFVAAIPASGNPIGPYSLPQAERLTADVEHKFWVVDGWKTGSPCVTEYDTTRP